VYGATFANRLADEAAAGEEMLILNLDGRAKRTLVRQATLNRLGKRTRAVVIQPVQETLDAVEMAAQTDIIRVLTHEILNSLTPVMSLAQTTASLLADERVDAAQIADARDAATTLARRTQGLGQFIDSYRVVAREPAVVRHAFAAAEFAEEHARLFRAEWPGVAFTVDCTPMTIHGDRALLSQLLLNLMRNAAQAASEHRPDPAVTLTIAAADPVMIEVADNGPGVPEKLRQEVFLPFFTTRAKGTGVGLNLARQIAVAHGGTLEVHDAPDGGALRKPLLARGPEFHEAILRLTHKYQLTKEDAQLGADGRTSLRKSCKLQTSADKFSNAGMAARAQADVHAAVAGNVVTNDASEEEAAILEKLPLVCGKLLALTAWNMSESPRVAPTPSSRGVPPTPSSRGAVTPAVPFGPLG
jgi:signal transduction histidine kinase